MSMTDPIAHFLTCIRNANLISKKDIEVHYSKIKEEIAKILKREGFIEDYAVKENESKHKVIAVNLKYGLHGEKVIRGINRESKPGRRVYQPVSEIKPIFKGTGIAIYSTSRGLLTDIECRNSNIGGEFICTVY